MSRYCIAVQPQAKFFDPAFRAAFVRLVTNHQLAADAIIVSIEHGYDVHLAAEHYQIRTEIKPTVGDDYPAVLRQLKKQQPRDHYGGLTPERKTQRRFPQIGLGGDPWITDCRW
jgi:hypothetical protein